MWILGILQLALENFNPEISHVVGQHFVANQCSRIEVLVRNEIAGLVGALLRLGAVQILVGQHLVLSIQIVLLEHHLLNIFLEFLGQLLGFGLGAAVFLEHGLPGVFVFVLVGGLGHVLGPALKKLVVEFPGVHHVRNLLLLFAGHLPDAFQIVRGLQSQRTGKLVGSILRHILLDFFFLVELILQLQVVRHHLLRSSGVFFVNSIEEDSGQRIVIGLRNGIVFVIVTAGACHGEAQKPAAHYIHSIVTLIGARHFVGAIIVIPGSQPQEASGGQRFVAGLRVQQIAGQLRLNKLVVRHVVVKRLNHPVPIRPGVRVRPVASGKRI